MQFERKLTKFSKKAKVTSLNGGVVTGEKGQEIQVDKIESISYRSHFDGSMSLLIKDDRNKICLRSASFECGSVVHKIPELEEFMNELMLQVSDDVVAERIEGSNAGFLCGALLLGGALFCVAMVFIKGLSNRPGKAIGSIIAITVFGFSLMKKGHAKVTPLWEG